MTLKEDIFGLICINKTFYNHSINQLSIVLEKKAEEFALGFAHFLAEHTYSCYESGWSNDFGHKELTTKELLEIYKKEKGY